jgi:hypothetical protein
MLRRYQNTISTNLPKANMEVLMTENENLRLANTSISPRSDSTVAALS